MPKFEKGSQEAKDYMAGLRAKRMSGGKMPQPPNDAEREMKRLSDEAQMEAQRQAQIREEIRQLEEFEARIQERRRVLQQQQEEEDRRLMPPPPPRPRSRSGGKITIRPPIKELPISMRPKISRPSPPEGTGLMSDIVGTVKKTAKKTRQVIKKTAESVKTVAQGGRDDYPPSVRKLLKNNGEKKIVSAIINRKPVEKKLSGLLNVLSLGQFKKNIENEPYDDLFHLSVVLRTEDGKDILVEKNEVINMAMKGRKGGENLSITPFQGGKTLNEIMENTKKRMGVKFFGYSARNNNCQDFIMALLQSNGMGDANDFTFVKQDAKQMFKGLGTLSKVADFITDLGGATNVLIKGTGGRSSKISMVDDMNAEMPVVMKQKGKAKHRPEKEKIIMVDESRWKQHLASLQEQQEELLNALFEIGNKQGKQKEYDKMDKKLNMLNEEIKMYENAIKGAMSGKGAAASVPANNGEDIVDEDYTETEMYLENEKMAENIERALIEELMSTFGLSSSFVKRYLPQIGVKLFNDFLVEQMERDIDWSEYQDNNTLSADRPLFEGRVYRSIIYYFKNLLNLPMS